jgi:hypothetical protein
MRWLANLKKHIGDNVLVIGDSLFEKQIETLNCITLNYNQFKPGQLWDDISEVLNVGQAEAKIYASTHCNLVSTWALLLVTEKTDMLYEEFFRYCIENNYAKENGFLNVDKVTLFKTLDYDFKPIYNRDYDALDTLTEGFYQMRIKGHFMACYKTDRLYLSDTSHRGSGIHYKIVPRNEFKWLIKY